jgi:hypothetical protein
MTCCCTFDHDRVYRPRHALNQIAIPPAAQAQDSIPPGFPADWLMFRFKALEVLRQFPPAYDAFIRFLRENAQHAGPHAPGGQEPAA